MKKKLVHRFVGIGLLMMLLGCDTEQSVADRYDATEIVLSDEGIIINGKEASTSKNDAVCVANDIVYYKSGMDFTYGEGTEKDAHSEEEAAKHVVVHISEPGNYVISGNVSKGQIAVDLGKDAEDDEDAVVTLIMNNADINCDVAPAIIFYNVYECSSAKKSKASNVVDTVDAGANILLVDNTVNHINGSYVAKIYDEVELNSSGTKIKDASKLHKYDGAIYSEMSMNIDGEKLGNGQLFINAENEGIDTELHLTINGGDIRINSGNDGINCNKDDVSVITMNNGNVEIIVNGATGEGDGIDSNGWIVMNGGTLQSYACGFSMDSGIDSGKGIHINGGTVIASGNMIDKIDESNQEYRVFRLREGQKGGTTISLKDSKLIVVDEYTFPNDFSNAVISTERLYGDEAYTVWFEDVELEIDEREPK